MVIVTVYECRGGIKLPRWKYYLEDLLKFGDRVMLNPDNINAHCVNCKYRPQKNTDRNYPEIVDDTHDFSVAEPDTNFFCEFVRKKYDIDDT